MSTATDNLSAQQRLLEAAGRVFAEKGFQDATVREISQLAGTNVASINYYFGDKERLYIETVKHAHRTRFEKVPAPQFPPGMPAELKLRMFIGAFLQRVLYDSDDCWHFPLLFRELLNPSAACTEMVESMIRPQALMLGTVIDELVGDPLEPTQRHWITFSIIGQCLHYRVARSVVERLIPAEEFGHYTPEILTDHITKFTLAALGVQPYPLRRASEPAPGASESHQ
jgi:AcrR family transcriptional regulator